MVNEKLTYYSTFDKITVRKFLREAKRKFGWTVASIDGRHYNITDRTKEHLAVIHQSADGHIVLARYGDNNVQSLIDNFEMTEMI